MSEKRAVRVVATSARLVAGAVLAAGCVLGVIVGVALPWPGVANEPAQVDVTPAAADATLVCTGDFRALGRNSQDAAQQFAAAAFDLTVDSNGPVEESTLAVPELEGSDGPLRLVGSAEQGGTALVAAAESVTLRDDDLSGLAASACRETRTESWLVGGAVETGTADLVILSNPGDVPATATLTAYGLEPSSSSVVVPAGTQLTVPLASIAAGAQSPVVRVTADGAPLRAELQSSLIRTLDPSGIDLQDSAGAPSDTLTFAGVQVRAASDDAALTVLRLMATEQAADVQVTVRKGGETVQETTVQLEAETPSGVNLEGLKRGTYSVEVTADAPVVGAVRQTSGTGAGTDFAWMTPAPEINGEVLVAVPDGPAPRLHLVNPGDADAIVSFTPSSNGETREISIPAGDSAVVEVREDSSYTIASADAVHVAVMMAGTDAIAGWPIWPGAAARDPVTVYP